MTECPICGREFPEDELFEGIVCYDCKNRIDQELLEEEIESMKEDKVVSLTEDEINALLYVVKVSISKLRLSVARENLGTAVDKLIKAKEEESG